MSDADDEFPDPRFYGYYQGRVAENLDPRGLGRVRVIVPGMIDEPSNWALPLALPGAGGAQRGMFFVPPVGADVAVFFHQGDVDAPAYVAGWFGSPGNQDEVPTNVKAAPALERPQLQAIETAAFLIAIDNRDGKEQLVIKDKVTGDLVQIDRATGIKVSTTKKLQLVATGDVEVSASGKVAIDGSSTELEGGGPGIARLGDAIVATIPPGVVMVPNPVTGTPMPSPVPIPLSGSIVSASSKASSG